MGKQNSLLEKLKKSTITDSIQKANDTKSVEQEKLVKEEVITTSNLKEKVEDIINIKEEPIIKRKRKEPHQIVRKNIIIWKKHQLMLDEMADDDHEINLSAVARRGIEKIYKEYKLKNNKNL